MLLTAMALGVAGVVFDSSCDRHPGQRQGQVPGSQEGAAGVTPDSQPAPGLADADSRELHDIAAAIEGAADAKAEEAALNRLVAWSERVSSANAFYTWMLEPSRADTGEEISFNDEPPPLESPERLRIKVSVFDHGKPETRIHVFSFIPKRNENVYLLMAE
jgi:hypothetical protein